MPSNAAKDIYIRPIELTDVNQVYLGWLEDPEVNQFLETRHRPQSLPLIKQFVESKINSLNEHLFAICLNRSGRHIGNIKVGPINKYHHDADISLFIGDKKMWGKGYAAQAIYLASLFAFEEKKVEKLKAGCYSQNVGSRRAFSKCGYILEGELRSSACFNGMRVNSSIMGLVRGELERPWK